MYQNAVRAAYPAPPELADRTVAAQISSFVCALAALCFFLSPITYFGYSEQPSAWTAWCVGALMFVLASTRLVRPASSTVASYINAALGVWVFCSPWIFGHYPTYLGLSINSMAVGAIVFGFSLFSAWFTRGLGRYRGFLVTEPVPAETFVPEL
jgi:hypothetical protein